MTKLLMLINAPFPYSAGGTQEKLFNQVKSLSSKDGDVEICSSNIKEKRLYYPVNGYAKVKNLGWNYRTFENNLLFKIIYFILFHINFVFSLYRENIDSNADVIEIKDPYSGIAGVWLKKQLGVPLVLETAGAFGQKMNKLYNMKYGGLKSKLITFFMNKVEKYVYKNCDAIITEDDAEEYMRGKGFTGKYYRIPNGVDVNKFKPTNKKRNYMLYLGRLNPEKNVDYIIKNKIPGRLVIVGTGTKEKELKEIAGDDVEFAGFKSNTVDYYNNASILIMASSYESLPCVVLEAMACEVPVVSTDVGMINEVIENGYNGFIYHLDKVDNFKLKLRLAINKRNNLKLGKSARQKILDNYDWDKLVDRYIKVYRGIR